jgi:hypothetical protein
VTKVKVFDLRKAEIIPLAQFFADRFPTFEQNIVKTGRDGQATVEDFKKSWHQSSGYQVCFTPQFRKPYSRLFSLHPVSNVIGLRCFVCFWSLPSVATRLSLIDAFQFCVQYSMPLRLAISPTITCRQQAGGCVNRGAK